MSMVAFAVAISFAHLQELGLTSPRPVPGIQVATVNVGGSRKVVAGDRVTVHVVIKAQGREIANTRRRGLAFTFLVGQNGVPAYLNTGVIGLGERGRRQVHVGDDAGNPPLDVTVEVVGIGR